MSIDNEELLNILLNTNIKLSKSVDRYMLEQILSLIIMNPLEDDRKRCQEQIKFIINQKVKKYDN